tara:strand:- start:324 stop:506 length:183 start_codon:yes stop_codon:yes gene_type:complete
MSIRTIKTVSKTKLMGVFCKTKYAATSIPIARNQDKKANSLSFLALDLLIDKVEEISGSC